MSHPPSLARALSLAYNSDRPFGLLLRFYSSLTGDIEIVVICIEFSFFFPFTLFFSFFLSLSSSSLAECGTTESVWACLHCQHFGCGRGGKKHALDHYKESGHPCVVLIGADKYVYCYECDDYVANDTADGSIKQMRKQLSATEVHTHVVTTEPQLNHSLTRSGRVLRKSTVSRDEIKAKYENRDRLETAMQRWRSNLLYSAFNTWRDVIRKDDDGKGDGDEKSRAKRRRKNSMVQVPGVRIDSIPCAMRV